MNRTSSNPTPFRTRPRPEVPVVVALAVVGLACAGLWWTGVVAPRVTAAVRSIGDAKTSAVPATMAIDVKNHGPLGVDVKRVSMSLRSGAPVRILAARISGRNLGPGARLKAGQAARIDLEYAFDCQGPAAVEADADVWVHVRSAIGDTRTRPASTLALQQERSDGQDFRDHGPLLCPLAAPAPGP